MLKAAKIDRVSVPSHSITKKVDKTKIKRTRKLKNEIKMFENYILRALNCLSENSLIAKNGNVHDDTVCGNDNVILVQSSSNRLESGGENSEPDATL